VTERQTWSAKEAGQILGVSTPTVAKWVREGRIKAATERPLRISRKEVDRLLAPSEPTATVSHLRALPSRAHHLTLADIGRDLEQSAARRRAGRR